MTNPPDGHDDEGQREADRQADAMKAQLRKDVDFMVQSAQRTINGAYCRSRHCCRQEARILASGKQGKESRNA